MANSVTLQSIIEQKLDDLMKLSERVRKSDITEPEIDGELRNMIISITVNLKSSIKYVPALKDLAEFVRETHSFLIQAKSRKIISEESFEKHLSFLRSKLRSCDKLPQDFAKEQLSLINDG